MGEGETVGALGDFHYQAVIWGVGEVLLQLIDSKKGKGRRGQESGCCVLIKKLGICLEDICFPRTFVGQK